MTVEEAYYKIAVNRRLEKDLREEINRLKDFIRKQRADPETILSVRNEAIYHAWKTGQSFKKIALDFKLSALTISTVCRRLECLEKRRMANASHFKEVSPARNTSLSEIGSTE